MLMGIVCTKLQASILFRLVSRSCTDTHSDKNMSKYRNPYSLLRASRRLENSRTNFVIQPPPSFSIPDTV